MTVAITPRISPEPLHPEWLDDALACIRTDKPVRKDLKDGGRLHVDRALPFLCVHILNGHAESVAQDVASANSLYLISPSVEAAIPIIEAVGGVLTERFGDVLVLDMGELERDDLLTDDVPYLPPFRIRVGASRHAGAAAAAASFAAGAEKIEGKFRTPHIERFEPGSDAATAGFAEAIAFPLLAVRFAPIYRQPRSDAIYPELRQRLLANIFDAGLKAFSTFTQSLGATKLTSHRVLGRKAFVDAVSRADRSIDDVASTFDFLLAVTPINADAAWTEFKQGDFRQAPRFLYRPLAVNVEAEKRKLFSIAFDHFEDPVLYDLYREKQQELDLQLSLISARESPRFIELGRVLYGPVEPPLLRVARDILGKTSAIGHPSEDEPGEGEEADCYLVDRRSRAMLAAYRQVYPAFDATVELRDDLPSGLMVSGNRLLISRSTRMLRARVEPLLSHEIGVHLLTYFNGSAQGLRLFRSGLAGYEGMQEGLAVFAEYMVGGMTTGRLRLIAARVVACAAMLEGASFPQTFASLVDTHGFGEAAAFNLVLRLYRGGGLAKDAIYLRGLLELLAHLKSGGALDPFWMGKISASHFSVMQELSARGLLKAPAVHPAFLNHPMAQARLDRARTGLDPLDLIEH